jgi:rubrerythrin
MFQKIKTFVLAFFLEHAIVLEEQAYHSYETIEKRAESADTEYLARILKGEELKQLLRLREIQKYSYVDQECTAMTNMDTLLETVKRGQAKDESGKVMELLQIAYKREKKASRFYWSVKERFPRSRLGDVFALIAAEGEKHAKLISLFLGGQG